MPLRRNTSIDVGKEHVYSLPSALSSGSLGKHSRINYGYGKDTHCEGTLPKTKISLPLNHMLKICQVEDVTLARRGEQVVGTLHLTPHHLIFVHTPLPSDPNAAGQAARPRELWITYPIIAFCTLRPAPIASRQPSSIRLRCRDFTFVCFYFANELKARDVYDSIRAWTCKIGRIEKLYAFAYQPQMPEKDVNSWGFYDPMKEWRRMGVGDESRNTKWRISRINTDYTVRFGSPLFGRRGD